MTLSIARTWKIVVATGVCHVLANSVIQTSYMRVIVLTIIAINMSTRTAYSYLLVARYIQTQYGTVVHQCIVHVDTDLSPRNSNFAHAHKIKLKFQGTKASNGHVYMNYSSYRITFDYH